METSRSKVMLRPLSFLALLLLLAGCADAFKEPPPDKPGPWDGRSFAYEARKVGENRQNKTIDLGGGYRVELRRNPYGGHGQCSRIWVYKYLPDNSLAGYPHSIDTCP